MTKVRKNKRRQAVVGVEQRVLLKDLRNRLACQGHLILRVSRLRSKHPSDFLAVPKDNPRQFVLVQPLFGGKIEVRPFCCSSGYVKAKQAVAEIRKANSRKVVWGRQLPLYHRPNLSLGNYVTPHGAKEVKRIIGLDV